jgi:alpha-N-arabinofuranosidase
MNILPWPTGLIARGIVVSALIFLSLPSRHVLGGPSEVQPVAAAPLDHDQVVYRDALQNGWQDYGWATISYRNTHPVHSGTSSISVKPARGQAVYIHHSAFDSGPYRAISFWISGGAAGGQRLRVQALLGGKAQKPVFLAALPRNSWRQVTVPLASLGVANRTELDGFWLQESLGKDQPTFYVDDISLFAVPALHVTVDASARVRTVDPRLFGMNTAVWYSDLTHRDTVDAQAQMGNRVLRFPGGSLSDTYDWSTGKSVGNHTSWVAGMADFASLVEKTRSTAYVTVNYGTGSAPEAAALVAWSNARPANRAVLGRSADGRDWRTAGYWAALRGARPLAKDDGLNFLRADHPTPYHFKYWEIGNENYGSWEMDKQSRQHDPYTYAGVARQFINLMKKVDAAIKIGVPVAVGENTYANYDDHSATNPRTGTAHNGWTPVLLSTFKQLGVAPDFVVVHSYAQDPGTESDARLLRYPSTWHAMVSGLRTQLNDYLGQSTARHIEIVCTETNSVTSKPGKQTTSLVNGLFLADSMGEVMQTEIGALLWWDLRDGGHDKGNNNSDKLYGWRRYGSFSVLASGGGHFPTFYARELLTHFAAGGDEVVHAGTDAKEASVFAALRADGGLTVLLINKSPTTVLRGAIAIKGFTTTPSATLYSYGVSQDTAAHTGRGSTAIVTQAITYANQARTITLAPYTMEVIVFQPERS